MAASNIETRNIRRHSNVTNWLHEVYEWVRMKTRPRITMPRTSLEKVERIGRSLIY